MQAALHCSLSDILQERHLFFGQMDMLRQKNYIVECTREKNIHVFVAS